MHTKFRLVAALAIVMAVSSAAPLHAQSEPEPTTIPNPRNRAEATWLGTIQPLHNAHAKRADAINSMFSRFVNSANELTTEDGLDQFVSEALSFKSKTMYVANRSGHREFIEGLFRKHVLSTAQLSEVVELLSKELDGTLADIDSNLLVEIRSDVPLDPMSIKCEAIDVADINRAIDSVIDDVCESVDSAVSRSLAKFGASAASGIVGESISRKILTDENGEISFWNRIGALAIGIGVDLAVDKVIEETVKPGETLKQEVRVQSRTVLQRCTQPTGPVGTRWLSCFQTHNNQLLRAVTREKAIDLDWANDVLKRLGLDSQWTLKP
ncbi:hypothetical protein FF011L_01680 [Roseimaritima multifibrata]|uniref:Uncharacterized protein n=1 Tax=Roseimaritima multifibrata TaxID=1930274 RepID=A0A517M965_9BACT|nr:hypothetical protein [Roseimaritima multifibrata]QDS91438.1 hypothetical protein FF011L_01680 [Roseimaritima multifibrata]